jgi:hypothetical protein
MALAGTLPIAQKLPGPNGAFLFRRSDVERILRSDLSDVAPAC